MVVFILNHKIIEIIKKRETSFEKDTIPKLIEKKQINVFKHKGFWQCMDNIREKNILEELLKKNKAPWKKW